MNVTQRERPPLADLLAAAPASDAELLTRAARLLARTHLLTEQASTLEIEVATILAQLEARIGHAGAKTTG